MKSHSGHLVEFLATTRKAWVGAIVTALLTFLAQNGIQGDMTVQEALQVAVNGLAGWLLVFLVPNKK